MIRQKGKGFFVTGQQASLHILFYGEKIVRFAYSSDQVLPASTLAVIAEPEEVKVKINGYKLRTKSLVIELTQKLLPLKYLILMEKYTVRILRYLLTIG